MKYQTWVVLLLASAWSFWNDEHFSHPNPKTGRWDRYTVDWETIGTSLTEERCQDRRPPLNHEEEGPTLVTPTDDATSIERWNTGLETADMARHLGIKATTAQSRA